MEEDIDMKKTNNEECSNMEKDFEHVGLGTLQGDIDKTVEEDDKIDFASQEIVDFHLVKSISNIDDLQQKKEVNTVDKLSSSSCHNAGHFKHFESVKYPMYHLNEKSQPIEVEDEEQNNDEFAFTIVIEDDKHELNDILVPLRDRKKQKQSKVFIGGLDKEVDEEDLNKFLGTVGEINVIKMSKNPPSQDNNNNNNTTLSLKLDLKVMSEFLNLHIRNPTAITSLSSPTCSLYLTSYLIT